MINQQWKFIAILSMTVQFSHSMEQAINSLQQGQAAFEINQEAQKVVAHDLSGLLAKYHVLSAARTQLRNKEVDAAHLFLEKNGYQIITHLKNDQLASTLEELGIVITAQIDVLKQCLSETEYSMLKKESVHAWLVQQFTLEQELKTNKVLKKSKSS